MTTNIIKFFKEDFWSFMCALPKCKKGGYCNQNRSQYYIDEIKVGDKSVIVYGYKYYCSKCGSNTTEYGKL